MPNTINYVYGLAVSFTTIHPSDTFREIEVSLITRNSANLREIEIIEFEIKMYSHWKNLLQICLVLFWYISILSQLQIKRKF